MITAKEIKEMQHTYLMDRLSAKMQNASKEGESGIEFHMAPDSTYSRMPEKVMRALVSAGFKVRTADGENSPVKYKISWD